MKSSHLPPGPKALPIIGHTLEFLRDPIVFFERCVREYGDVVYMRPPSGKPFVINHAYLVNNAHYAEQVLIRNHRGFIKSNAYNVLKPTLGNGLVTSEGEFWVRQRKLMQPAFHRERLANYAQIMVSDTERMLEGWKNGQELDLLEVVAGLTQEIIVKVMFGARLDGELRQIGEAAIEVIEEFGRKLRNPIWIPFFIPTPRNLRWLRAKERLDAKIYRLLEERRASGVDQGDLLSMLIHAQAEDGSRMTDQHLRDELITIFLAGHETSALTLVWAWYLLSQHPEVEQRLVEHTQGVLGGRSPTMEDYPRLTYAAGVVKESLRLFPPAWFFGRQSVEDTEVGGYPVAKGTDIWFSTWMMHRDERYYAQPERFWPERWETEQVRNMPKCAFLPFAQGPRQCIGSTFSVVEATLLLATVAPRYQLRMLNADRIRRYPGISLHPSERPRVLLKERRTPRVVHSEGQLSPRPEAAA
jgi:cytochrome P450